MLALIMEICSICYEICLLCVRYNAALEPLLSSPKPYNTAVCSSSSNKVGCCCCPFDVVDRKDDVFPKLFTVV